MGAQGSKGGAQPKKKRKYKGHLIQTLEDHDGGVNCMALSEDGSVLATGSEDKVARLWSTMTEDCECIGVLQGHEDYITCILMEDNYVVTGSADKTIRKWDICTCDCVLIFSGHNSPVNRIICTGDFIFSSSYDRTSRCWDFDSAECVRVFTGHKRGVYPMVFIPADDDDVNVDTFDWEGNKDILITGSADFTARSWSFETGKTLKVFKGHTGSVTCMGTDPAGTILYTGSTDASIKSWNIIKGENLKTFEGHNAAVLCMTVQNKILYTGSSDWTSKSWVVEFGDCTRTYKGHKHSVSCLKFIDGLFLTGSGDGIARVFDAKSGSLVRQLKGHSTSINCIQRWKDASIGNPVLARSQEGVTPWKFFTGSGDGTAHVYEAKSGSLKLTLKGHSGVINALQVVEGRLFTGSHDGTVKVWDITGLKEETEATINEEEEEIEEETKIIIDDTYPYGDEYESGSAFLRENDYAGQKTQRSDLDIV